MRKVAADMAADNFISSLNRVAAIAVPGFSISNPRRNALDLMSGVLCHILIKGKIMTEDEKLTPEQRSMALTTVGPALFELGTVFSTPAAAAVLKANGVPAIALLTLHSHGEWGRVSAEDVQANNAAILSGERILSSYLVGDQMVWIVTNAFNLDGFRSSSCILLPSEY